jgi:hypothetical protein
MPGESGRTRKNIIAETAAGSGSVSVVLIRKYPANPHTPGVSGSTFLKNAWTRGCARFAAGRKVRWNIPGRNGLPGIIAAVTGTADPATKKRLKWNTPGGNGFSMRSAAPAGNVKPVAQRRKKAPATLMRSLVKLLTAASQREAAMITSFFIFVNMNVKDAAMYRLRDGAITKTWKYMEDEPG